MKPIPPDLSTGVAYGYMPVTHINAGLEAARVLRGQPVFRVNRKPRGGGGSSAPAATDTPVIVYEDLTGASRDTTGKITLGAVARCLPVIASGAGFVPDLEAEFIEGRVWSLGTIGIGDDCGCGGNCGGTVPTGPRISLPLGPEGINRVKNGQTLAVTGYNAVPGESLTLTIDDGVNTPVTPEVTNNGDGTWTAAATSIAALNRGVCVVEITNGATRHKTLILNSLDEWEPGSSNSTGAIYWTSRPPTPDLHVDSDTGASQSDNVTDSTSPSHTITFGGSTIITPGGDVEALLYFVNQDPGEDRGEVVVAGGTLADFDEGLVIERAPSSALSVGTYEVSVVLRLHFDNSGYDYDEWWSPPSDPLRIEIVADIAEEETQLYGRLGFCYSHPTLGNLLAVDGCSFPLSEAEVFKLTGEPPSWNGGSYATGATVKLPSAAEFDAEATYNEGELAVVDGVLYQAITNLGAGEFDDADWIEIGTPGDWYVANTDVAAGLWNPSQWDYVEPEDEE